MVRIPNEPDAALVNAAYWLIQECGGNKFTISFSVNNHEFALPEGRTRMYLEKVPATNVGAVANKVSETVSEAPIRLVFMADTNDTRFNSYGVLRPLSAAPIIEAQRAAAATAPTEETEATTPGGRYG